MCTHWFFRLTSQNVWTEFAASQSWFCFCELRTMTEKEFHTSRSWSPGCSLPSLATTPSGKTFCITTHTCDSKKDWKLDQCSGLQNRTSWSKILSSWNLTIIFRLNLVSMTWSFSVLDVKINERNFARNFDNKCTKHKVLYSSNKMLYRSWKEEFGHKKNKCKIYLANKLVWSQECGSFTSPSVYFCLVL